MNFHLNIRTDFSLGESLIQLKKLCDVAKEKGYESLTLMDTMSIHGMVEFSMKAKAAGIKPNIGCRLRVVEDPRHRKPKKTDTFPDKRNLSFMPKAYALNDNGLKSIMAMLSRGTTAEYFYYVSRIGIDDMLEMEDVAFSTGDLYNLFQWPKAEYESVLEKLISKHGKENLYVELTPINTPLFDTLNAKAIEAAKKFDLKTIATYPAFYLEEGDSETLEMLWSITNNTQWDAPWRPKQFVKDFHLQDAESLDTRIRLAHERVKQWNGVDEAGIWASSLVNAARLEQSMKFEYKKLPVSLPKMADDEFMTLGRMCIEGFKERLLKHPVLGFQPKPEQLPTYRQRLQYELNVLRNMGFSGYFLMTADLVMWAKNNGIIVGPGRGSVGGSLVAYLIGITEIDPIRFDLLFERFINPERLDLPDADLDFMSSRRHEVVGYLQGKYGVARVAGISNYSRLGAASALRDTGRILGINNSELSATKLVPSEHGQTASLEEAAAQVPEIANLRDSQPELWKHAMKLEGAMRSFGQHAAGCVVAGEDIINRAVCETRAGTPVVNWDKRVVEDLGLVKMDLLGLSTLDTLGIAADYIKQRHGKEIDYTKIPLDDPKVLEAFGNGETTGVFQVEGHGARKMLREMGAGGNFSFNDVVALNALNRPGPLDSGIADKYIHRKNGEEPVDYPHKRTEPFLAESYGVPIYQEQIMKIAVSLCGFTNTEADHLRKAIGKKDKDKMQAHADHFVTNAVAGYANIELEDGSVIEVHPLKIVRVKGTGDKVTVKDAFERGLDIEEEDLR